MSSQPSNLLIPPDFIFPRQIVVASDLTDIDELLPHISAQAKACKASVTLVHAIGNSPIDRPQQHLEQELYARQLFSYMRQALEIDGVRCSFFIRNGAPADAVAQQIIETRAGRLIIGTHWHGACGQNMIGKVANSLLLTATVPVFVIPPELNSPCVHARPRRILHPVQPSTSYRDSMCFAAEIAHACNAELTLLHVIPSSNTIGPYAREFERQTRHQIEDFLIKRPHLNARTCLEYGDPVRTILQFSASQDIDWIVMGISHDFPWWSRQNSHTYQVIAESGCPVLTFHHRIFAPVHTQRFFTEQLHSA